MIEENLSSTVINQKLSILFLKKVVCYDFNLLHVCP